MSHNGSGSGTGCSTEAVAEDETEKECSAPEDQALSLLAAEMTGNYEHDHVWAIWSHLGSSKIAR